MQSFVPLHLHHQDCIRHHLLVIVMSSGSRSLLSARGIVIIVIAAHQLATEKTTLLGFVTKLKGAKRS